MLQYLISAYFTETAMGKTIAQKIVDAHLVEQVGENEAVLKVDTVFCHEITTPMGITDLINRGMDEVFDPSRIKAVIDHVTPAKDSSSAQQGKVLRDWARRHGIKDFFDIGSNGVCHALFPEKGFVRPGTVVIMGDSHTCTHGAFGAYAVGVGTTDLAVGILKGVCRFQKPESIKITVNGVLPKGVYPKDVILRIIKEITVNGATDKIIEFHGDTVEQMSMEGRMTLSNMAIEAGGTSGICQPDMCTAEYLLPFYEDVTTAEELCATFQQWHSDSDAEYADEITLNAADLEPQVTFDYKPDCVKNISEMEGTPVDQVYIGSCTNGRIEDLREACKVIEGKIAADTVRAIVSPATPAVFSQALEEVLIDIFMKAGFCVTNPTCGACLGMSNGVLAPGEVCASTTNRNFRGRMGKGGMVHLMSPVSAAAAAVHGCITDPRKEMQGKG
jgi:3-isopropylmalate/(R)-2-methylmalate dehydratase large subunit